MAPDCKRFISPNGWSINVPLSYTAGTPLTVAIANTNGGKQFRGLLSVAKTIRTPRWSARTAPAGYVTRHHRLRWIVVDPYQQQRQSQRTFSLHPALAAGSGP